VTLYASHAFATPFAHAAAGYDFTITPKDTHTPVALNIPSGTYRMCLAPLASDFLRVMEACINSALSIARSTTTATVTLSDAGIVTFTFSAIPDAVAINAVTARRLGLATSYTSAGILVGSYPVWYLALLSAGTGGYWQPVQSGGFEQTSGGVVYGFAASYVSYTRALDVQWQPTTATDAATANADATPMYPGEAYMNAIGDTSSARQWSVLDVIYASRNVLCGVAIGTWRTLKASTSLTLWQAYLAAPVLLSTEVKPYSPQWTVWQTWTLELVAPSTGMQTTRA